MVSKWLPNCDTVINAKMNAKKFMTNNNENMLETFLPLIIFSVASIVFGKVNDPTYKLIHIVNIIYIDMCNYILYAYSFYINAYIYTNKYTFL